MKFLYAVTVLFCCNSNNVFSQYDSLKPGGLYTSNFIINEIPRNLTYYMPQNYGKLDLYPLLIFLHDEKSSAMNVIKQNGDFIHAKADSSNCMVMYPDAVGGVWKSNKDKDSLNDKMFISIMINFFVQQYHCDGSRIYVLGIGEGCDVAYQLSCERNRKITAIAAVRSTYNKNKPQSCAGMEAMPVVNLTNEAGTKAAIGKAWDFLLSQKKEN